MPLGPDDVLPPVTVGRVLTGKERDKAIALFLTWYETPQFRINRNMEATPLGEFCRERENTRRGRTRMFKNRRNRCKPSES